MSTCSPHPTSSPPENTAFKTGPQQSVCPRVGHNCLAATINRTVTSNEPVGRTCTTEINYSADKLRHHYCSNNHIEHQICRLMAHFVHQRSLSAHLILSAATAKLLSKCWNLHGRNVDECDGFLGAWLCRGSHSGLGCTAPDRRGILKPEVVVDLRGGK